MISLYYSPAENVTKFLPAGQAVFGSIGARRHDPVTGPQACCAVSDYYEQRLDDHV